MTMGLTAQQQKVFDLILERDEAGAIAPSFEELRAHIGLRSKSGIVRIVNGLVERGVVRRLKNRARALEVVRGMLVEPLPEVRQSMEKYASDHRISVKVAAEEALRAYFVGGAP